MAGWFLFEVCIMVNDIESLKHPSFCNRFAQPFLHEALVSRSPLSNASLWEIVQARTSLSRCRRRLPYIARRLSNKSEKIIFFPIDARHSEKWLSISEKKSNISLSDIIYRRNHRDWLLIPLKRLFTFIIDRKSISFSFERRLDHGRLIQSFFNSFFRLSFFDLLKVHWWIEGCH